MSVLEQISEEYADYAALKAAYFRLMNDAVWSVRELEKSIHIALSNPPFTDEILDDVADRAEAAFRDKHAIYYKM